MRKSSISTRKSGTTRRNTNPNKSKPRAINDLVVRGQRLVAEFDGLRLVLIGALNELPMLDMCAKAFTIEMHDWNSNLSIKTSIETFVNIYNSEKSAWEPLIEPWDLGFHVAHSVENNNTSVSVFLENWPKLQLLPKLSEQFLVPLNLFLMI